MGQCSANISREDRRRSFKKQNLGGALKDTLSRRKMHFFFANALRCRRFPNFLPDIFLKTQRHLFVVIIFKTEGSKEFSFWKIFILLYLQITCYRDMQLTCISIYQYRSSYIIKTWIGWKNESIRAYYRSTPRESSIKKDYWHELFPKTSKKLNSWLPRQVQTRRRCHRLLGTLR